MPVSYIDKVVKQKRFLAAAHTHLANTKRQAHTRPETAPYRTLAKPRKPCGKDSVKMGRCWSRVMDELAHSREKARLQQRMPSLQF
jgi:hypothetical protein